MPVVLRTSVLSMVQLSGAVLGVCALATVVLGACSLTTTVELPASLTVSVACSQPVQSCAAIAALPGPTISTVCSQPVQTCTAGITMATATTLEIVGTQPAQTCISVAAMPGPSVAVACTQPSQTCVAVVDNASAAPSITVVCAQPAQSFSAVCSMAAPTIGVVAAQPAQQCAVVAAMPAPTVSVTCSQPAQSATAACTMPGPSVAVTGTQPAQTCAAVAAMASPTVAVSATQPAQTCVAEVTMSSATQNPEDIVGATWCWDMARDVTVASNKATAVTEQVSGGAQNLASLGSSYDPDYTATDAQFGNRPSISATSAYRSLGNSSTTSISQPFTIVHVGQMPSATQSQRAIFCATNSSSNLYCYREANTSTVYVRTGGTASYTGDFSDAVCRYWYCNGASSTYEELRQDGTRVGPTTINPGTSAWVGMLLHRSGSSYTGSWATTLLMMVSGAIDSGDQADFEDWLTDNAGWS